MRRAVIIAYASGTPGDRLRTILKRMPFQTYSDAKTAATSQVDENAHFAVVINGTWREAVTEAEVLRDANIDVRAVVAGDSPAVNLVVSAISTALATPGTGATALGRKVAEPEEAVEKEAADDTSELEAIAEGGADVPAVGAASIAADSGSADESMVSEVVPAPADDAKV